MLVVSIGAFLAVIGAALFLWGRRVARSRSQEPRQAASAALGFGMLLAACGVTLLVLSTIPAR